MASERNKTQKNTYCESISIKYQEKKKKEEFLEGSVVVTFGI